jgi:hypothetical protein
MSPNIVYVHDVSLQAFLMDLAPVQLPLFSVFTSVAISPPVLMNPEFAP